ncbi:MAG TPA: phage integrase N-terminal SAM-like domain-containing protein [Polyangiaceae bacterium]|nr:phage integrase N-terminal SAM-like domain-containing protein [Polyangiaceae bacterium]
MTMLKDRMMQDLKLAGHALKTQKTYVECIGHFAQFCWSPEQADQTVVRAWVEKLQKSQVGVAAAPAALRGAEVPVRQDPCTPGAGGASVVAKGSEAAAEGVDRGAGGQAARCAGVAEVPGLLHHAVRDWFAVA